MEFEGGRKRGRHDGTSNGNGGHKRSKQEMESFSTGIGSKSKPCTKFFSTTGCPFGDGCHFLHYVPGGYKAVSQMLNIGGTQPQPLPTRNPVPSFSNGSSPPAVKSRMCTRYNTAEGCKFGHKCHYAHGEWELGKSSVMSYEDPRTTGRFRGGPGQQMAPPPQDLVAAAGFGASATAKISIDAKLAGAVIGKNGVNSKQISRTTGAKLSVRDHDADPNLRNIELEGTFDQIKQASAMVHELIVNVSRTSVPPTRHRASQSSSYTNNLKTKICDNFQKGTCTFGEKCHFAHGAGELRTTAP